MAVCLVFGPVNQIKHKTMSGEDACKPDRLA
jgi:hypothetical protein